MMKIGMLWRMNGTKDLVQSVCDGCQYYSIKYGSTPNIAHVNPVNNPEELTRAGGCEIINDSKIQRGHVWLGFDKEAK